MFYLWQVSEQIFVNSAQMVRFNSGFAAMKSKDLGLLHLVFNFKVLVLRKLVSNKTNKARKPFITITTCHIKKILKIYNPTKCEA